LYPPWSNNGTIITVVVAERKSRDFLQLNPRLYIDVIMQ
jgi:hypothetical protein